ncbi:DNA mismatch endonuclease Vsr [Rhizobium leguminosarum]|uniref:very short patch repair endonuclease n=1 Tax=Rhizobium leguminosarum TaxID=384 RepID=UPI001030DBD0|nr:very short patch repair endonuclease [Rhizobium leguminosarum]TAZ45336.1 DNA mismatch endonuclease Vsr [Rhizobium leguminosarum]
MTSDAETIDPTRRRIMASVGQRDTKPEMIVRRLLHAMNYRYRLHRKDLPGRPDIVFSSRRKAIFVHGCFWHRHPGCKKASVPTTRADFWADKFARNVERDAEVEQKLHDLGWETFTVWECETSKPQVLGERLRDFLQRVDAAPDEGERPQ